jgi:hypothetical protein
LAQHVDAAETLDRRARHGLGIRRRADIAP